MGFLLNDAELSVFEQLAGAQGRQTYTQTGRGCGACDPVVVLRPYLIGASDASAVYGDARYDGPEKWLDVAGSVRLYLTQR